MTAGPGIIVITTAAGMTGTTDRVVRGRLSPVSARKPPPGLWGGGGGLSPGRVVYILQLVHVRWEGPLG
jgi:hypothetical protein